MRRLFVVGMLLSSFASVCPEAMAQEEICAPADAAALDGQLDLATGALKRFDLSRARSELQIAREKARCLDAPIEPTQMARLAWLHAELGVFVQDLEEVWRWVRTARDADPDAPIPEHIAIDHPLRRYLPDQPEPPPIEGPDRAVAHPKKGGVYLDGKRLEAPRARRSTPHLVQVFAGNERVDAWWQSGPVFHPSILEMLEPETVAADEAVGPKRWKPARKNTIAAWEDWIADNPDSEWVGEARIRLDRRRFELALEAGEAALKAYLADDPGPAADAARAEVERIHFEVAKAEASRQGWSVFLAAFPNGVYASEAERAFDDLSWARFEEQDTEEAYARYLTQHPDGAHRQLARERLMERAFESASASREDRQIRAYLERFPGSPYAPRARALLAGTRLDAVQIAIDGLLEEDAKLEEALREKLVPAGVRVERVPFPETVDNTLLPAGNGLLWIDVARLTNGKLEAEAALWAPVGAGPLARWTAESPDLEGLVGVVVEGMPDVSDFR
jgi:hypothetical protein